jgi:hypothetical protein
VFILELMVMVMVFVVVLYIGVGAIQIGRKADGWDSTLGLLVVMQDARRFSG